MALCTTALLAGHGETVCLKSEEKASTAVNSPLVSGEMPVLPFAWGSNFVVDAEPLLGEGSFGRVSRIVDATGNRFAVKVLNHAAMAEHDMSHQLVDEVHALQQCTVHCCRHVVKYFDLAHEGPHVFLLMELCHGCLLDFTLAQPCSHLTDVQASVWAAQLLEGLQDMHAVGILHRDIKPDNLLLTSDGSLRISDFGWAARLEDRPSCLAGTFHYMAPEVLRQREVHTEAVDAWSAGMTFVELTTGRTMLNVDEYTGLSQTAWLIALEIRTMKFLDEIAFLCPPAEQHRPVHLSTFCWSLLRSLVEPELARRSSVSAALCHPWLRREKTSVLDCSTSVGESFLEDSSLLNDSGLALLEFMPSPGMSLITTSPAVLRRPASPCPPERSVSDLQDAVVSTVVRSMSCDEGLQALRQCTAEMPKQLRHELKTVVTVSTSCLPTTASGSTAGSGSVASQSTISGGQRLQSTRVAQEGKQESPFAAYTERQMGTFQRRTLPVRSSRTTFGESVFTIAPRAKPVATHGGPSNSPVSVQRELASLGPQRALCANRRPQPSPAAAPRTTLTIGSGHQFHGARPGQNVRWTLPAPGCNERKVLSATGNNCTRRAMRIARGACNCPIDGQQQHVSSTHRLCGVPRA